MLLLETINRKKKLTLKKIYIIIYIYYHTKILCYKILNTGISKRIEIIKNKNPTS